LQLFVQLAGPGLIWPWNIGARFGLAVENSTGEYLWFLLMIKSVAMTAGRPLMLSRDPSPSIPGMIQA